MAENLPGLVYMASDGTEYRVDLLADQWFAARQDRPEASFCHDIEGRDAALLRGLLTLVSAWLDDPGDPRS